MRDWRGDEYPPDVLFRWTVDGKKVPQTCDWEDCDAQAVQNQCNAEGSNWERTHHHGGIHRLRKATEELEGHKGTWFCAVHGEIVRSENSEIRNATAAARKKRRQDAQR